jgi:hypothetical protein
MERRGERSERGDLNREIQARNAERERLNGEARQVTAEIIDLAAERAKRTRPEAIPTDQAAGQGRAAPTAPGAAPRRFWPPSRAGRRRSRGAISTGSLRRKLPTGRSARSPRTSCCAAAT